MHRSGRCQVVRVADGVVEGEYRSDTTITVITTINQEKRAIAPGGRGSGSAAISGAKQRTPTRSRRRARDVDRLFRSASSKMPVNCVPSMTTQQHVTPTPGACRDPARQACAAPSRPGRGRRARPTLAAPDAPVRPTAAAPARPSAAGVLTCAPRAATRVGVDPRQQRRRQHEQPGEERRAARERPGSARPERTRTGRGPLQTRAEGEQAGIELPVPSSRASVTGQCQRITTRPCRPAPGGVRAAHARRPPSPNTATPAPIRISHRPKLAPTSATRQPTTSVTLATELSASSRDAGSPRRADGPAATDRAREQVQAADAPPSITHWIVARGSGLDNALCTAAQATEPRAPRQQYHRMRASRRAPVTLLASLAQIQQRRVGADRRQRGEVVARGRRARRPLQRMCPPRVIARRDAVAQRDHDVDDENDGRDGDDERADRLQLVQALPATGGAGSRRSDASCPRRRARTSERTSGSLPITISTKCAFPSRSRNITPVSFGNQ